MLRAEPKSWFSWDFRIFDGSRELALIDLACFREAASFTVGGSTYKATREGLFRTSFTLEQDGSVIARASKPSAWKRTLEIEHGASRYTLKAKSSFGRTFVLLNGDNSVGMLQPDHSFTRKATIDLPDGMPLPVQIFVTLLMIILWKRDSDAAAGGA
jgi:hypothetical protein